MLARINLPFLEKYIQENGRKILFDALANIGPKSTFF